MGISRSVEVIQIRLREHRVLLHVDLKPVPAQQLSHLPDATIEIVNLHHYLLNPGPVSIFNAGEYLELTFLDIDLQQIDLLHALIANHF